MGCPVSELYRFPFSVSTHPAWLEKNLFCPSLPSEIGKAWLQSKAKYFNCGRFLSVGQHGDGMPSRVTNGIQTAGLCTDTNAQSKGERDNIFFCP